MYELCSYYDHLCELCSQKKIMKFPYPQAGEITRRVNLRLLTTLSMICPEKSIFRALHF